MKKDKVLHSLTIAVIYLLVAIASLPTSKSVVIVDNVTALQALNLDGIENRTIALLGYTTDNDGGQGLLYPADVSETADNLLVFQLADGTKFKRIVKTLTPEMGGAVSSTSPAGALGQANQIAVFNKLVTHYEARTHNISSGNPGAWYHIGSVLEIEHQGSGWHFDAFLVMPDTTDATAVRFKKRSNSTDRLILGEPCYIAGIRKGSNDNAPRWASNPDLYDDVWLQDNTSNINTKLSTETDIGFELDGCTGGDFRVGEIFGFTVGGIITARSGFCAYNDLNIEKIFNCRFGSGIYTYSTTLWCNENRLQVTNTNVSPTMTHGSQGCYGYFVATDPADTSSGGGQYFASNNVFESGNFESQGESDGTPYEHVGILIESGEDNRFLSQRHDDNTRYIGVRVIDKGEVDATDSPRKNYIELARPFNDAFVDVQNNGQNVITYTGQVEEINDSFTFRPHELYNPLGDRTVALRGMQVAIGLADDTPITNVVHDLFFLDWETDPERPRLDASRVGTGTGPGFWFHVDDESRNGTLSLTIQGQDVRVGFVCFDAVGGLHNLADVTDNAPLVSGTSTTENSSVTQLMTSDICQTGSTDELHVNFHKDVKKVFIRFTGFLEEIKVVARGMHRCHIEKPIQQLHYATQEPESGRYIKPHVVYNSSASATPHSWVLTSDGETMSVHDVWSSAMALLDGEWIDVSGNVWMVVNPNLGTGGTDSPTGGLEVGDSYTDNAGVVWRYMGTPTDGISTWAVNN